MNLRSFTLFFFACVAGAIWPGTMALAAPPDKREFIEIPLVFNVLEGADTKTAAQREAEIKQAIKVMNEILKDQNTRVGVKLHAINNNVPVPGGGPANLDVDKRKQLEASGLNELPDGKGIKLVIGKDVKSEVSEREVVGVTNHKGPVAFVNAGLGSLTYGEVGLHEILHTLTLHHTDDKTGIMYPISGGHRRHLSKAEINELREGAKKAGVVVEKLSTDPTTPSSKQGGAKANPGKTNSLAPDHKNIMLASLNSSVSEANYELRLHLGGLVPDVGGNATLQLLFNTDNNAFTGQTIGTSPGIDRVVRIDVVGPGLANFTISDPSGANQAPLSGTLIREPQFEQYGEAPSSIPSFLPGQDVIDVTIPKSLLQLTGGSVFQATVLSGQPLTPDDIFTLALNLAAEASDPHVSTNVGVVTPGVTNVFVSGSNFTPSGPVELQWDDFPPLTLFADPFGNFETSLLAPPGLTGPYAFLTGTDVTGERFGFAAVDVVPEPSTFCTFAVGLLGLAAWAAISKRDALRGLKH